MPVTTDCPDGASVSRSLRATITGSGDCSCIDNEIGIGYNTGVWSGGYTSDCGFAGTEVAIQVLCEGGTWKLRFTCGDNSVEVSAIGTSGPPLSIVFRVIVNNGFDFGLMPEQDPDWCCGVEPEVIDIIISDDGDEGSSSSSSGDCLPDSWRGEDPEITEPPTFDCFGSSSSGSSPGSSSSSSSSGSSSGAGPGLCGCCAPALPAFLRLTVAGVTAGSVPACTNCASLNGTFDLPLNNHNTMFCTWTKLTSTPCPPYTTAYGIQCDNVDNKVRVYGPGVCYSIAEASFNCYGTNTFTLDPTDPDCSPYPYCSWPPTVTVSPV